MSDHETHLGAGAQAALSASTRRSPGGRIHQSSSKRSPGPRPNSRPSSARSGHETLRQGSATVSLTSTSIKAVHMSLKKSPPDTMARGNEGSYSPQVMCKPSALDL